MEKIQRNQANRIRHGKIEYNIIQKKQRNIISTFKKEDGTNPGEETLHELITSATKQINKKYTKTNSFSRNYIMSKNEDWIYSKRRNIQDQTR